MGPLSGDGNFCWNMGESADPAEEKTMGWVESGKQRGRREIQTRDDRMMQEDSGLEFFQEHSANSAEKVISTTIAARSRTNK